MIGLVKIESSLLVSTIIIRIYKKKKKINKFPSTLNSVSLGMV